MLWLLLALLPLVLLHILLLLRHAANDVMKPYVTYGITNVACHDSMLSPPTLLLMLLMLLFLIYTLFHVLQWQPMLPPLLLLCLLLFSLLLVLLVVVVPNRRREVLTPILCV
jgi:hypothetical protein